MSDAPSAILVYEHITGGGVPADRPLPAWAAEAEAVLRTVAGVFREWGRLPVVTTRDERLDAVALPADEVVAVAPGRGVAVLPALATRCGAALVIAPESGGALERATAAAAAGATLLLGSPAPAVAAAADKWTLHLRLSAAGLPVPATLAVDGPNEALAAAASLGYPVVVKPRLGASCEGVVLVSEPRRMDEAVADALRFGPGPVLVQRFADGVPASVSLLAAGGAASALCLNTQDVVLGGASLYRGGVTAVDHPRREEAFTLACDAVRVVPGLRGLMGVDVILGDGGCSVVELNPRVTTAVLGLSGALAIDLASAWWRACVDGTLPAEPVALRGPVPFSTSRSDERCGARM